MQRSTRAVSHTYNVFDTSLTIYKLYSEMGLTSKHMHILLANTISNNTTNTTTTTITVRSTANRIITISTNNNNNNNINNTNNINNNYRLCRHTHKYIYIYIYITVTWTQGVYQT
jgi:predicted nucleic acid-binding protein